MFTDSLATPARVEVLVNVLRELSHKRLDTDAVYALLDPSGNQQAAMDTFRAVRELNLVAELDGRVAFNGPAKAVATRSLVLHAIDEHVLCEGEKGEKYFALYYGYLLGRKCDSPATRELEVEDFNRMVFGNVPQNNPFNPTKLTGIYRWIAYSGLGWPGPDGKFVCNPFERLQRRLPAIFKDEDKLDSQVFMARLSKECPELDGGAIFCEANPQWNANDMRCTIGLCDALSELHDAGIIRLNCPADARGWSLEEAPPAQRPPDLLGAKMDSVEHISAKRASTNA